MNIHQTSKLTGIPESTLLRMRARETRSLKGGPPYSRKMGKDGKMTYIYNKAEVLRWMKYRRCLITAADAADILQCSRDMILSLFGIQTLEIKTKGCRGKLLIDNGHNIYVWIPENELRPFIRNIRR